MKDNGFWLYRILDIRLEESSMWFKIFIGQWFWISVCTITLLSRVWKHGDILHALKNYQLTCLIYMKITEINPPIVINFKQRPIIKVINHYEGLLEQITEASSPWPQFSMPHPLCGQFSIELSLPEHLTLSSQIWPLPAPKRAEPGALTASGNPSWRQTTRASLMSQSSSQTVPHLPLLNISTLPSPVQLPPTSLNSKNGKGI